MNQGYGQYPPPQYNQGPPQQEEYYPPPNDFPPPQGYRGGDRGGHRGGGMRGGDRGGPPPRGGGGYDDYRGDHVQTSSPRLYVGKYGQGTAEVDLLPLFQQYGRIVDHIIQDKFAFIEFQSVQQAGRAMEALTGHPVRGGRIIIEESKPRRDGKPSDRSHRQSSSSQQSRGRQGSGGSVRSSRLYVGNIEGTPKRELEGLFETFGRLVDCLIQADKNYGFVEFDNPTSAQRALEALDGSKFRGEHIKVQESKPRNDGQPRGAPPSRSDRDRGDDRDRDRGRGGRGGNDRGDRDRDRESRGPKPSLFAKVRGLPFNQTRDDLETLIAKEVKGVEKDNIVLEFDINGKFSGSAYIKLARATDISSLKKLEDHKIGTGKRYIEVIPVDEEDFQYGLDNFIPEDPRISKISEGSVTTGIIRIRGIPFKCTEEQITLLFKGFQIIEIKILNAGERTAGEALVVFSSKEAALHSLNWEGQQIEGRYIEITLSNMKEYETFSKHEWDVMPLKKILETEERRLHDDRLDRQRKNRKASVDDRKDNRGGDRDRSRSARGNDDRRGGGGVSGGRGGYQGGGGGYNGGRDNFPPPQQQQNFGGQQGGYGGQYGGQQQQQQQQYPPPQQQGGYFPPPQQGGGQYNGGDAYF